MPAAVVHNLTDPNDPAGRTHKQINMEKRHAYPVGTLVEMVETEWTDGRHEGVRLYVVYLHRDCDGTPLYALSWNRHNTVCHDPRFHNPDWFHGIAEQYLRQIETKRA